MSTATEARVETDTEPGDAIPHDHPSDLQYVKIAIVLAVITAAEVLTYFWEGASTLGLVLVLFPMMIAKFFIVTGWFMHLKYDNPIYRRIFLFGLLLATAVFLAALSVFEFWDDRYFRFLQG
jgi:cytochrome c oxidase subunit IV